MYLYCNLPIRYSCCPWTKHTAIVGRLILAQKAKAKTETKSSFLFDCPAALLPWESIIFFPVAFCWNKCNEVLWDTEGIQREPSLLWGLTDYGVGLWIVEQLARTSGYVSLSCVTRRQVGWQSTICVWPSDVQTWYQRFKPVLRSLEVPLTFAIVSLKSSVN